MYQIGICDDNQAVVDNLIKIIEEYARLECEKITIYPFTSGEALLLHLNSEKESKLDLIFLDIDLKSINGVDIGIKIREEDKNEMTQLVFISGDANFAMSLFKVRPLDFLIKPIDKEMVFKRIKLAMAINQIKPEFTFNINKTVYRRKVEDILYFESIGRQIKITTSQEAFLFYGKLKEILERLESYGFFLVHKSILVNYRHVITFSYDYVEMSDHRILNISNNRKKAVRLYQAQFEQGRL